MLEKWEEFKAGPQKLSGSRLYVSLNQKGQFLLNAKVIKALGDPPAVTLYYEKHSGRIGMMPSTRAVTHAFPIAPRPHSNSRIVHASPFCRHYGIKVKGTVAFAQIEIGSDRLMKLTLDDTYKVSRVGAR